MVFFGMPSLLQNRKIGTKCVAINGSVSKTPYPIPRVCGVPRFSANPGDGLRSI